MAHHVPAPIPGQPAATVPSLPLRLLPPLCILAAAVMAASVWWLGNPHLAASLHLPLIGVAAAGGLLSLALASLPLALMIRAERACGTGDGSRVREVRMILRSECDRELRVFESVGIANLSQRRSPDGQQVMEFDLSGLPSAYLARVQADVPGTWQLRSRHGAYRFRFTPALRAEDYMFSLSLVPAANCNAGQTDKSTGYARVLSRTALLAA